MLRGPVDCDSHSVLAVGTIAAQTFLSLTASEWTAIGAVVSALATVGLLSFARSQLKGTLALGRENQRLQQALLKAQTRPYVVANLESRSVLAILSIQNLGNTPAFKVTVSLDKRFRSAAIPDADWQDSPLFSDGIPMMAPSYKLRFALDSLPARKETDLEPVVSGTISYLDADGHQFADERFVIDLNAAGKGLRPDKTMHDLVVQVEALNASVKDWAKNGKGLRVNTINYDRELDREARPMHIARANRARAEKGWRGWLWYWIDEWRGRLGLHEW